MSDHIMIIYKDRIIADMAVPKSWEERVLLVGTATDVSVVIYRRVRRGDTGSQHSWSDTWMKAQKKKDRKEKKRLKRLARIAEINK